MKYFAKHPTAEKWLILSSYVLTQEFLDELNEYAKLKPKYQNAVNDLIQFMTPKQVLIAGLKNDDNNYYYYHQTKFNYVYKFNIHHFTGQKNQSGSYELEELETYHTEAAKFKEIFQLLKGIKLKDEMIQKFPHINYSSSNFSIYAKLEELPSLDEMKSSLEEEKNSCEFFDDETYVLLYDSGYLDADGYTSAQLSGARLFPNFDSAKRSLAKRSGDIAIMKITMQCKEAMLGENKNSTKIKAYAEKQRIEAFLASTNPDELSLLKEKIAEYEKQLNIAPSLEKSKKKSKI